MGFHECHLDNKNDSDIGCLEVSDLFSKERFDSRLMVYIKDKKFYAKYCPFCGFSLQPERLNPETRKGYDSLNSSNK